MARMVEMRHSQGEVGMYWRGGCLLATRMMANACWPPGQAGASARSQEEVCPLGSADASRLSVI